MQRTPALHKMHGLFASNLVNGWSGAGTFCKISGPVSILVSNGTLSAFKALLLLLQCSEDGQLYKRVLIHLANTRRITMSTACGCVRRAFTNPKISLALTDLNTADFLISMLTYCFRHGTWNVDYPNIHHMYACCGASLMDMLPLVSDQVTNLESTCFVCVCLIAAYVPEYMPGSTPAHRSYRHPNHGFRHRLPMLQKSASQASCAGKSSGTQDCWGFSVQASDFGRRKNA